MSQATPVIPDSDGATFLVALNAALQGFATTHKGSSAPSYKVTGMIWIDDTATPWILKLYDGTDWIAMGAFHATNNTFHPYMGAAAMPFNPYATDTGSANAYAIAPSPAISAYATGQIFFVKPANVNTGSSTLAVNGLSAITCKMPDGSNLPARALITTRVAMFMYDGTNMIYLNPPNYLYGSNVASAGTLNLDTATGDYLHVTGTTTITAITLAQGRECTVVFDGILTLTNGASLILPTGSNIATAAGDIAVFRGEASGVVRCIGYLRADGTGLVGGGATVGTPAASTSGTSIDITGIPSGKKIVLCSFKGNSTNGTSNPLIQIGDSGGVETTGYSGSGAIAISGSNSTAGQYTTGFGFTSVLAANVMHGIVALVLIDESANTWAAFGVIGFSNGNYTAILGGTKSLTGTLDRVRFTTVGGSDTWDAGAFNVITL